MTLLLAPSRLEAPVLPWPERRRNRSSRVFGPPYPFFDRRALRTPVPGWQLRLHRSFLWRAVAGEVPTFKRVIDVMGALVLLTALAPVLILLAAIIKLQDGGPILYWQTRVGRRGRCFAFPKFRSMVVNADAQIDQLLHRNHHANGSITFKDKADPRVTRAGRFIRKYSLDELPQLWCVLLGDMSLVGPRPPLPREVDRYTPRDLRRLEVAPGLTCLWQVEGRGDLPFDQQVELDLRYVDNQSLRTDIVLLLRTPWAVLKGKGAY
ncbi:MAG TPA: sugar transferase [Gemmataceae bacterium]|jgi:lipopolysaccharide/colanic/teichoic acid biosynthesis glycosyltransferase|nr:sugar transferase [Gemmataceae bacterium]